MRYFVGVGKGALIKLGGGCDSNCLFCHAGGPRRGEFLALKEVCRRVLAARDAGFTRIVLSGGEPTAHPEVVTIARFIQKAGLGLGLVTNGRALAGVALRTALLEAGLGHVHVSLHGPTAEVHDGLAGVASFTEVNTTLAALRCVERLSLAVTTVVCRANLPHLNDTVAYLSELLREARCAGPPSHRLTLVEAKGRALDDRSLLPDPADASAAVGRALTFGGESCGGHVQRGFDGFPTCLEPAGGDGSRSLRSYGVTAMQEVAEDRLYSVDEGRRAYGEVCRDCGARSDCPGLYAGYFPEFAAVLVPMERE